MLNLRSTVHVLVTLQRLLQNAVGSNSEPSLCFQADNVAYAISDIFSWPLSNSFSCASLKVSRLPRVIQSLLSRLLLIDVLTHSPLDCCLTTGRLSRKFPISPNDPYPKWRS